MLIPFVRRMRIMTKHYPVEQRERAVKMVLEHLDEYRSVYAACQAIGPKVGVGAELLRRWVLQAQVDDNQRPGVTSAEQRSNLGIPAGDASTMKPASSLNGSSRSAR